MTPHGAPARVIDLWEQGVIDLLISKAILAEYERVLRYPQVRRYHQLDDEQIRRIYERFRKFGRLTTPERSLEVVKDDPTDNMFLECAVAGAADVIVSGDKHLRALGEYEGIPILSPAEFIQRLGQGGD
jgi:putative PIN family toxin of toxin-antitoxin system